ncbi:MAG: amidohydrolase family protein [Chitinivibrionales bacterium]|nr:amidohydrolase family protein [Chitinivibrionales bacterium]
MSTVYYARWLLLPDFSIVTNGALAVEGQRIAAVGARSKVRRTSGDRIVNLGNVLLMPGLINMHTHLEEGIVRGIYKEEEEPFSSWIAKKSSRIRQSSLEAIMPTIRLGVRESLTNGITTIVDSSRTGASLVVLKEEPIRSWVIHEWHDEQQINGNVHAKVNAEKRIAADAETVNIGAGPYSLFSLLPGEQKSLIELSRRERLLWATHLAESSEELQAFSEQKGDLFFHITRRRDWPFGETTRGSVSFGLANNLIPNNALLFHCNYTSGQELSLLAAKKASVIVTPRYNHRLGHKNLSIDVAMNRGVHICIGSEGVAGMETMNLFDELFYLKQSHPHIPAPEMIKWVTLNPAKALGMHNRIGVLQNGALADIVGVSFAHDPQEELLEELLEEEPDVRFVMVNGEEIIVNTGN